MRRATNPAASKITHTTAIFTSNLNNFFISILYFFYFLSGKCAKGLFLRVRIVGDDFGFYHIFLFGAGTAEAF